MLVWKISPEVNFWLRLDGEKGRLAENRTGEAKGEDELGGTACGGLQVGGRIFDECSSIYRWKK